MGMRLGAVYMEGGRSKKADQPSAICFLYSLYMQKVVLGPNAMIPRDRIFLAGR